jgi:phospholipase/lecithinase/hemolysin
LLVGGKFGRRAAAAAVDAVKTAMKELEKASARNPLIFKMPKMGDTPDAQSEGRTDVDAAKRPSMRTLFVLD